MSEPASATKMMPMSGRMRTWPVMRAVTASVAPRESEPVSPMMIWAGWTLNHRKPSSAPMIRALSTARLGCTSGALARAMMM